MDWGVAFGLAGVAVGTISLVYARTQAVHVQRQADAAQLATTLELERAMTEKIYQLRMDLVTNPVLQAEYAKSNPRLLEIYGDVPLAAIAILRNALDGFQDIYFLRKQGIVQRHQWLNWSTSFVPIARIPMTREAFNLGVQRGAFDPEFVDFVTPLFEKGALPDPLSQRG